MFLERNFRGKTGEIDIIAQDGEQVVFLEVRARSNRKFAGAASSVNRAQATACRKNSATLPAVQAAVCEYALPI